MIAMRVTTAACCWLLALPTLASAEPIAVQRWSSDEPVAGELVEITAQGVELRVEDEIIPETIPWFDVREFEGHAQQQRLYRQAADDAWRAHQRLERGDYPGALAIYRQLAPGYLWMTGPQSADVSVGLARCLIDRGDRVAAVRPAMSWFVSLRTPGSTGQGLGDSDHAAVGYRLMIDLPPMFSGDDRRQTLDALPESQSLTDRDRLMHAYYALSLESDQRSSPGTIAAIERIEELRRSPGTRDAGVELFEDMVFSGAHPDPAVRESAGKALERRLRVDVGTWIEVWARLGLASALLDDPEAQANERGLIELIHIIVRLGDVRRPLTILAAEMANEYLASTDRPGWGARLMLEARMATAASDSPPTRSETSDSSPGGSSNPLIQQSRGDDAHD